jgi:hypothetical protein
MTGIVTITLSSSAFLPAKFANTLLHLTSLYLGELFGSPAQYIALRAKFIYVSS